jgi:hypothetical protein
MLATEYRCVDNRIFDGETGWFSESVFLPSAGSYYFGIGLGEAAEGTVPTVLALDNLRISVPVPGTLALLGTGLIGLGFAGFARRRKTAKEPFTVYDSPASAGFLFLSKGRLLAVPCRLNHRHRMSAFGKRKPRRAGPQVKPF